MKRVIGLVYFEGCPNAKVAKENLAEAMRSGGLPEEWKEWDLMAPSTPGWVKQFGSPTVLVNGKDVTGDGPGASAMACRADGAPEVSVILKALREPQNGGPE
jgi:hypothetical protein